MANRVTYVYFFLDYGLKSSMRKYLEIKCEINRGCCCYFHWFLLPSLLICASKPVMTVLATVVPMGCASPNV